VVFRGFDFIYTFPSSYNAAGVSTLWDSLPAAEEGSSEEFGSHSEAFCSMRMAADDARAIFSSRCVWRTKSWIIL
jgi:hypothetical protein